ncbi:MAG: polyprenyl synthetase family protein [Chloroflexota bacterium]
MNPYAEIAAYLVRIRPARTWSELQDLIHNTATRRPHHWRLPLLACEATGSAVQRALPAAAAVACMHMSIMLLDDMLDADRDGLYRQLGMPATANLAAALQSLALQALASGHLPPSLKRSMMASINCATLVTAYGQYLDVQHIVDETAYWRVTRLKSAPFFGAALHTGALAAAAPSSTARSLRQFGRLYGEIVQIHDDLKDVFARPASPDWRANSAALPILFAETVNHPQRQRFATLKRRVAEQDALLEAQSILIRCGAVSYCVDQALRRHGLMRQLLSTIPLEVPAPLEDLLEALIAPIEALIDGITLPSATAN